VRFRQAASFGESEKVLIEFDTDPEGFDEVGLNAFIEALEKVRKKMER
jgi:hypothetical protein